MGAVVAGVFLGFFFLVVIVIAIGNTADPEPASNPAAVATTSSPAAPATHLPATTSIPATSTAPACPGDKSDQVTRLDDDGEFSSQEDGDLREEVKLTIRGAGAEDNKYFPFCGTVKVVLERKHYAYPNDYYTLAGEFTARVQPSNFTGYFPSFEFLLDDDAFSEDGTYRATVTVTLDRDGRTLSTAKTIFYSNG